MKPPKIKCIKRTIESKNWPNGFIYYCLRFSNGKDSLNLHNEKIIEEKIIYEGECPKVYRVLPKIELKYCREYIGGFRSQIIPRKINQEIAISLRGECWGMYDRQCYNQVGEIISTDYKHENDCDGVYEYLHSLLKDEDWERIEKFKDVDMEEWCKY